MKDMRTRRIFALAYLLFSPFLLAKTPEHGDECLSCEALKRLRCTRVLSPDYDFSKEEMGGDSSAFVFNTPNFTTPWYLWGAHTRAESQEPGLLWQSKTTLAEWDQLDPTLQARQRLQDSFDGDLTPIGEERKYIKEFFKQIPNALLAQEFVPTSPQDLRLDVMRLPFPQIELLSFEHIMPSSPDLLLSPRRLAICHPPATAQVVLRFLMKMFRPPEELAIVGVSFTQEEAHCLIKWARDVRLTSLALLDMKGSVPAVFVEGLHYHFYEFFGKVQHPYPLRHLVLGADEPLTPIIKCVDGTIGRRPSYFPTHQVISKDLKRLRVDASSMLTRASPIPTPPRASEIMRLLRIITK